MPKTRIFNSLLHEPRGIPLLFPTACSRTNQSSPAFFVIEPRSSNFRKISELFELDRCSDDRVSVPSHNVVAFIGVRRGNRPKIYKTSILFYAFSWIFDEFYLTLELLKNWNSGSGRNRTYFIHFRWTSVRICDGRIGYNVVSNEIKRIRPIHPIELHENYNRKWKQRNFMFRLINDPSYRRVEGSPRWTKEYFRTGTNNRRRNRDRYRGTPALRPRLLSRNRMNIIAAEVRVITTISA